RLLSRSRSPIQLGAELYGDASPAADIEIISLMLATLEQAQIPEIHMDLGHVGVYRGLARAADLSADLEAQIFDAMQRKAVDEVTALTEHLPADLAAMLNKLCQLCGGREVLEQAKTLLAAAPESVLNALDELIAVADALMERYPHLPFYFDLGELRGYHYHTGVVFAAFVPGVGQSIAQGGRYDDIGAVFGRARPATGFSTDLKSLVDLGQQAEVSLATGIWAPAGAEADLWQAIGDLRRAGQRVVQALPGQTVSAAAQAGCDRQLVQNSSGWQVKPL